MSDAFLWLTLNFLSLVMLSFYSMMEMACVSLNRVRLEYWVNQNNTRAKRLSWLLRNSSRLFGTTLIGVNVAMMFGSEFSRQFHESIGLSPDLAPLTQVMIVIIIGELAPMFAARRFSEHTALLGANLLYFSAKVMKPFLFIIGLITHAIHWVLGGRSESFNLYLNQEEIKKILEEHHPDQTPGSIEELNKTISNIFTLRSKCAVKIMNPIANFKSLPANATIRNMRQVMLTTDQPFTLVYHKSPTQIIGLALPRELLREADNRRLGDHCRQPWFITLEMEAVQILHQFRNNKEPAAIVIDKEGKAIGVITLQDVLDEIFGHGSALLRYKTRKTTGAMIERTFPGDMPVKEFNDLFGAGLPVESESQTLADLMIQQMGHHPEVGDTITIQPFDLQVKESTLLEIKQVIVRSRPT